jgi:hypothetical protein
VEIENREWSALSTRLFDNKMKLLLAPLALLLLLFTISGCGPDNSQGTVFGKVTLNGEPCANGLIRMVPVDGNSQPNDSPIAEDGSYEIKMPIGEKKVELTWRKNSGGVPDTATQGTLPPSPQLFPTKYNSETTLKYTVKPGRTEENFAIKEP